MHEDSPEEGRWLEAAQEVDGMTVGRVGALPDGRLAEVRELYRLLDPALPAVERDTAEPALAASAVTVLAALAPDGRLAGLVTLVAAQTLARTRAWAEDLVVHPDFRGRGVGKTLMAVCAEAAAEAGAATIDGTVDPNRHAALALYIGTGWEVSRSTAVRRDLSTSVVTRRPAGTHV